MRESSSNSNNTVNNNNDESIMMIDTSSANVGASGGLALPELDELKLEKTIS